MFRICVYLLCCFRFIALGGRLCGSAARQYATRRRDLPTSAPSLRLSAFIPSKLNEQTRARCHALITSCVLFVLFCLLVPRPPNHTHTFSRAPGDPGSVHLACSTDHKGEGSGALGVYWWRVAGGGGQLGRFPRIGAFHTWIHLSWHLFAPRFFTFPIL